MKRVYPLILLLFGSIPLLVAQSWEKVDLPFTCSWIMGETQGNLIAGGDGIFYSKDKRQFTYSMPGDFQLSFQMANYKNSAFVGATNGLLRSDDGGKSWSVVKNGEQRFIANFNDTLYTGRTAAWYSSDGGNSWQLLLKESWHHYLIEQFFVFKGRYFVRLNTGKVISIPRNGYDTTAVLFGAKCIYISEKDPDRIFAGTAKGVCISDDLGKTWTYPDSLKSTVHDINRNDTAIFAATSNGLFYSNPETIFWRKIGTLNYISNHLYISGGHFYMRYGGKLLTSSNGVTWEDLYKGLFNDVGMGKPIVLTGTEKFNFLDIGYKDVDLNGCTVGGGRSLSGIFAWMGEACDMVFTYSQFQTPAYTSDGIHWKGYSFPTYPGAVRNVVGHRNRVYIGCYNPFGEGSEKLGWSAKDSVVWKDFELPPGFQFRRVAASDRLLFLEGVKNESKVLMYSADEGKRWVERPLPMFGELMEHKGKFFCWSEYESYFSADSGQTWSPSIPGLPSNLIPSMIVHKGQLYCIALTADNKYGGNRGWNVFKFNDRQQEFSDFTLNLLETLPGYYPDHSNSLCNWPGSYVILCTDQKNLYFSMFIVGMYQLKPKDLIIDDPHDETELSDLTVFPNPSSGQFQIENSEIIESVRITNLAGSPLIKSSINAKRGVLELSSLQPGPYILEVISGTKSASRIIIRN